LLRPGFHFEPLPQEGEAPEGLARKEPAKSAGATTRASLD
jgi:hypothetical protein